MLVFLEVNDIKIVCTDEELIELGSSLANGSISFEDLLNWIIDRS